MARITKPFRARKTDHVEELTLLEHTQQHEHSSCHYCAPTTLRTAVAARIHGREVGWLPRNWAINRYLGRSTVGRQLNIRILNKCSNIVCSIRTTFLAFLFYVCLQLFCLTLFTLCTILCTIFGTHQSVTCFRHPIFIRVLFFEWIPVTAYTDKKLVVSVPDSTNSCTDISGASFYGWTWNILVWFVSSRIYYFDS